MNHMARRAENDTSEGIQISREGFGMVKIFGLVDRKAYNASSCA